MTPPNPCFMSTPGFQLCHTPQGRAVPKAYSQQKQRLIVHRAHHTVSHETHRVTKPPLWKACFFTMGYVTWCGPLNTGTLKLPQFFFSLSILVTKQSLGSSLKNFFYPLFSSRLFSRIESTSAKVWSTENPFPQPTYSTKPEAFGLFPSASPLLRRFPPSSHVPLHVDVDRYNALRLLNIQCAQTL